MPAWPMVIIHACVYTSIITLVCSLFGSDRSALHQSSRLRKILLASSKRFSQCVSSLLAKCVFCAGHALHPVCRSMTAPMVQSIWLHFGTITLQLAFPILKSSVVPCSIPSTTRAAKKLAITAHEHHSLASHTHRCRQSF